jgi:peptidoglycan/xylan/chitin deacetylase (PgdA/CDA1 family)
MMKTCPRCGTQTDANRAACLYCYAPLDPILRPARRPKRTRKPINLRKALLSRQSLAVYCAALAGAAVFGIVRIGPRIAQSISEHRRPAQVAKSSETQTARRSVKTVKRTAPRKRAVVARHIAVPVKPPAPVARPETPKTVPIAPMKPEVIAKVVVPIAAPTKPVVKMPAKPIPAAPKPTPLPTIAAIKKAPTKIAKAPAAVVRVSEEPRTPKQVKPERAAAKPETHLSSDPTVPKRYHGYLVHSRVRRFPEKVIAITFDDGPDRIVTPRVLKTLAANNVHATFFVVGQQVKRNPDLLRRVAAAGHAIESHSYTHPQQASESSAAQELDRTQRLIREVTGKTPMCFRPPYGTVNALARVALKEGFTVVTWTVTSADCAPNSTSGTIAGNATAGLKPGDIILVHDGPGHSASAKALPQILAKAKKEGFRFVTVPELLRGWDKWLVATSQPKKSPTDKRRLEAKLRLAKHDRG